MAESIAEEYEKQLHEAIAFKNSGNALYRSKEVKDAIRKYHHALMYIRSMDAMSRKKSTLAMITGDNNTTDTEMSHDMKLQLDQVKRDVYNNLAACLLQQDHCNYIRILEYCDEVLKIDEHNEKALYRKGVACYHMKSIEKALELFGKVQIIQAGNKHIDKRLAEYIKLCQEENTRQNEKMKRTYKGMFDKMSKEDT